MARVTLQQAKDHLLITTPPGDPGDVFLQQQLDMAEVIILDYLKCPAPDPSLVINAAILLQLGELWRFRGDDVKDQGPNYTDGYLSPVITNLLRRLRDPAIA